MSPKKLNASGKRFSCGACLASEIIARKWVPIVVCHLLRGPKRYNDLRNSILGISSKVLSQNLANMEKEGMIAREVQTAPPLAVWYRLTEKGQDLASVIRAMNGWGEKWMGPLLPEHVQSHLTSPSEGVELEAGT